MANKNFEVSISFWLKWKMSTWIMSSWERVPNPWALCHLFLWQWQMGRAKRELDPQLPTMVTFQTIFKAFVIFLLSSMQPIERINTITKVSQDCMHIFLSQCKPHKFFEAMFNKVHYMILEGQEASGWFGLNAASVLKPCVLRRFLHLPKCI